MSSSADVDDDCSPQSDSTAPSNDDAIDLGRRQLLKASAALLTVANVASIAPEAEAGGGGGGNITTSVARYIAKLLKANGCTTLFGVPGATCDALYEACEAEGFTIIVTASDMEAGYAADAYARRKGLAALAVTYGVGTLSLANPIAGAYTERSPVILFNGGPNASDISGVTTHGIAYSHGLGTPPAGSTPMTDLNVFKHITGFAESLGDSGAAAERIRAGLLFALRNKRPAYIEVSKAIWRSNTTGRVARIDATPPANGEEADVAGRILTALRGATRPVVMLGIEIQRYGLADQAEQLVRKLGLPWTTTLLAKSVIPESTPGFIGVYDGPTAPPMTRNIVGGTNCLLTLGCQFGRQYRDLIIGLKQGTNRVVEVRNGKVAIRGAAPVASAFPALMTALAARSFQPPATWENRPRLPGLSFEERRASVPQAAAAPAIPGAGMSNADVMREVDRMLDPSFVVIADTSLSMFPAASLNIRGRDGFLCNAVWQSIGYSAAAAAGVALADPGKRPLVLCGDGGFQMTVQGLSTLARRKLRAIIVVLDNASYAIEQYVIEKVRGVPPTDNRSYFKNPNVEMIPFLELSEWDYPALAKALGFSFAEKVSTASELRTALAGAKAAPGPAFIAAKLNARDLPAELLPS